MMSTNALGETSDLTSKTLTIFNARLEVADVDLVSFRFSAHTIRQHVVQWVFCLESKQERLVLIC